MKEATGELNTTVVVVLSIGVLATFFFSYLWPIIKHNFDSNANCSKAICNCEKNVRDSNDGFCLCNIKGGPEFKCTYKG
ncbi:MAG: hypothetical protein RR478_00055 [Bacilli bacterium]